MNLDRKMISAQISDILNRISRLNNNICAMDTVDIQRYPENYEVISTEAALRAERIACMLRNLLFASTGIPKREYYLKASEEHGIEINYEDGILEVTLPRLLPKKKTRQSVLFLTEPLHAALEQYTEEHPAPRFRECVICISHVYGHDLPDWCIRDYDNIQQKQILDTVALYVMADDSGLLCDAYNTTERGEKDCIRIYIMEKGRFGKWISERENQVKNISDF